MKLVLVAAAALVDGRNRVLLAERPEGKPMAGLWEFPGGKVEAGETPEATLVRELREELSIEAHPADLEPLAFASHAYPDFHLLMPLFLCRRWTGEIVPVEGQRVRWVAAEALPALPTPAADVPLIPIVVARLRASG